MDLAALLLFASTLLVAAASPGPYRAGGTMMAVAVASK
jgi:threonine/homoserine/homoserine lactone efflux protein